MMLPFQRRLLGRARVIIPGTTTYNTPGTYTFIIPEFNLLTFTIDGAGGGGGGAYSSSGSTPGSAGFASAIAALGLTANGGGGGQVGLNAGPAGATGTAGTASGGDTNTTGGGSLGGVEGKLATNVNSWGGPGGRGGRLVKAYVDGALVPGASISIVVGAVGVKGFTNATAWGAVQPFDGAPGLVSITVT